MPSLVHLFLVTPGRHGSVTLQRCCVQQLFSEVCQTGSRNVSATVWVSATGSRNVSVMFLQLFLPPCATEKSDLHTVQSTDCGPFVERPTTGCTVGEKCDGMLFCFFVDLFFTLALHSHVS